jgi:hypothetical protein
MSTRRRTMKYSKEFIEKVKAEYPRWMELHDKLDSGSRSVGEDIYNTSYWEGGIGMCASEILKAFDEGRQDDIKKAAEEKVRRQKLYDEWKDLYR